jgi:2-polyprenyl-6-methoxyphenol hydroxylase-like FAD-dependent oxidoreductase
MRILIVGGGIAGTALASFLQDTAEVTIAEKASHWGTIGYVIILWANGQRMLRELGIDRIVLKNSYQIPWIAFSDKHGRVLQKLAFDQFNHYGPTIGVTRTDLHQAIAGSLSSKVKTLFGTTVAYLHSEKNQTIVTFNDGHQEPFDLVVGADGIHSQIRDQVFGSGYLKPYGWDVWSFWIPKDFAPPQGATELTTGGRMYTVYPLAEKAVVIMTADSELTEQIAGTLSPQDQLLKIFADFKPSVQRMIQAIEDPKHIFHDQLSHVDMSEWYKDRVVLVGDAQHAASPITGMGSSMALEDAFVLAQELKRIPDATEIPAALARYAKRRHTRVSSFRELSTLAEKWIAIKSPVIAWLRDQIGRWLPDKPFAQKVAAILQAEI